MKYIIPAFMVVLAMVASFGATAAKPEIDPSYANGELVYMIGPHLIPDAATSQPNLYAHSEELYLLVYPINNEAANDTEPHTLPSGYQPNCNPCYHPGVPPAFAYHDHVLTGAPGFGKTGTAGEYKAPWKIVILIYSPDVFLSPDFVPIKDAKDIDPAEQAGMFIPINADLSAGPNPYEVEPGALLICPLVSPHA